MIPISYRKFIHLISLKRDYKNKVACEENL